MKRLIAISFLLALSGAYQAFARHGSARPAVIAVHAAPKTLVEATLAKPDTLLLVNPVGDSIVQYAHTFLGTPYKYGCCSPSSGFDCSGFTWFVFKHYGYSIPRSSKDYVNLGKEVSLTECRKGDIILFRGTHANDKSVGHVGIIISNPGEPVKFIHSSSSKNHRGVVVTDYYNSAYPKRFVKICRVL
jgi:cell wall-associated NlpC family hydrolase